MILFTKNACPGCDYVKRAMASDPRLRPASLQEQNVDHSPTSLSLAHKLGIRSLPTLYVDGSLHVGPSATLAELDRRTK